MNHPHLLGKTREEDPFFHCTVAAANDDKAKADQQMAEEMQKLTGGLNLPPGMKLPF